MTREEEIKQAILDGWNSMPESVKGDELNERIYNQGAYDMLQWAEENPKNPWRDAKNDPPKDEGRVFVSYAGLKSSAYYYGDGEWDVDGYGLCDFVNYWMLIPETPEGE